MEKIKTDRLSLRKFGITMGIAFLAITFLILIRHKHSVLPTAVLSAGFFVLGFISPNLLKPIYIFWMGIAFVLGWINTRIILAVIFYLIFVPTGLIMKLLGKDLLDTKIDKNKDSYWKTREKKKLELSDYERQF